MLDPLVQDSKLDCLVRLNAYESSGLYEVLWDLWTRFPRVRLRELEARIALRRSLQRQVSRGIVEVGWALWASEELYEPLPEAEVPAVLDWPEVWRPGHRYLKLRLRDEGSESFASCIDWRDPDGKRDPSDERLVDPRLWLLASPHDLEGTAYVELLPGTYSGQCWQPGSLFFTEERWAHVEPIIRQCVPSYDHYAFTDVPAAQWRCVIDGLNDLVSFLDSDPSWSQLPDRIGFFFANPEDRLSAARDLHLDLLRAMVNDFRGWLQRRLQEDDSIAILGL